MPLTSKMKGNEDFIDREACSNLLISQTEERFKSFDCYDKEKHPHFICMSAPGTGKSTLCENALNIIMKTDLEPLKQILNNNSVEIRVTYNGITKFAEIDRRIGAQSSLACRILASYFGIKNLDDLRRKVRIDY